MDYPKNPQLLLRLLDIGRQMAETEALEPLLIYAVDVALDLLNGQYGFIILNTMDDHLHFQVARDSYGNNIQNPETQVSRTILYRAMENREHVLTASAITDSNFGRATSVSSLELKSVLCVPLISQGDVIGAIYLENRSEYDLFRDEDVLPLQYLASHAAVCIQNALLNDELERLSIKHIREIEKITDDKAAIPSATVDAIVKKEGTRILRNFMQDSSHQFRTPLANITLSVDILRRKIDTDKYGEYLERILLQINIMVGLVDNLHLLSKLDASIQDDYVLEADNLVLITHEMWEVMQKQAHQKQVRFNHIITNENVIVPVAQEYIRKALEQIIINSLQYTTSGGLITLDVIEDDKTARIVVKDTGIGIKEDDLPKLKTRFFRVDTVGTTRGLGLGLTIAEKIMQLHGGQLMIDSEFGQGTIVELIFPKE